MADLNTIADAADDDGAPDELELTEARDMGRDAVHQEVNDPDSPFKGDGRRHRALRQAYREGYREELDAKAT